MTYLFSASSDGNETMMAPHLASAGGEEGKRLLLPSLSPVGVKKEDIMEKDDIEECDVPFLC